MLEGVPSYLRYRIVNRLNAQIGALPVEVVANLPHLHQSTWNERAMQPGAPGSVAIGDFKIPLHPPGSEGFKAAWPLYQLVMPGVGEGLRVEGYLADVGEVANNVGVPGAELPHSGIITEVAWSTNPPMFELRGKTDAALLDMQRTYPGEIIHNTAYDSVTIVKEFTTNYLVGVSDQFNPFTAGNYTSTNLPALTAATWSGTTDPNGVNPNVVSASTGTGAVLISKTSMGQVDGDPLSTQIVECICRLKTTSTDVGHAGTVGIGFSASSANASDSLFAYLIAKYNSTTARYDLDVVLTSYVAGVETGATNFSSGLTNVDDADGYIPLQMQFIQQGAGGVNTVRFVVNGSPLNTVGTGPTYGINPVYPMIHFRIPAAGSATAYFTNLLAGRRVQGMFSNGSFGTPVHKFRVNQQPAPTFLDMLTLCSGVEGWYWRIDSSVVSSTSGFCGQINMNALTSIGTDHSADVIFEEEVNLVSLTQQGNADTFGSDLQFNGYADSTSGGISYARNLTAMNTYGWLSGVGMSMTVQDYSGLLRQGAKVATNKGTPGGSYVAKVVRDPGTADKFRELDYVTIHCPTLGVDHQKMLVMSYDFTEGEATQTLTLGQYGTDDLVGANRVVPGVQQIAGLFKNR